MNKSFRHTKIIATLGPASFSPAMIRKLIKAGVNIFRINFSHVDYDIVKKVIKDVRQISKSLKIAVGILIDLQGPKIRIGKFEEGSVLLCKGQSFTITTEDIIGDSTIVSTGYSELVKDAKKGKIILLDDGRIRLKVTGKGTDCVYTKVLVGGHLYNRKGMNFPNFKLSTPALTVKDKKDTLFGIEQGADYFALSFVQQAKDVVQLRELLKKTKSGAKIIAKIEKPEAVQNVESIIEAADGIMIARGDLGVELSLEDVPSLQKSIIKKTNFAGKPVIVATQMLESMIESSMPTRAEVSDVATAIYDWADAVMLSGETAVGKYPIQTVQLMSKVATKIDLGQAGRKKKLRSRQTHFIQEKSIPSSLCDSADELADEIKVSAIITFTDHGRTARLFSKHRASVPIISVTDQQRTYQEMTLYRGVLPVLLKKSFASLVTLRKLMIAAEKELLTAKLVKKGQLVIITAGVPFGIARQTNMLRVHKIGEEF